jgi:DNA polymerase V
LRALTTIGAQLRQGGISTVADLVRIDMATIRRGWSVVLERTVREQQAISSVDLEDVAPAKKEIVSTRSFGQPVLTKEQLAGAVTDFAILAAEKLQRQGSLAGHVNGFIRTSPFGKEDAQLSLAITQPLRRSNCDALRLVQAAIAGLNTIYKRRYRYAKAGVMLLELQRDTVAQQELELDRDPQDAAKVMTAVDRINLRYGRRIATVGARGWVAPDVSGRCARGARHRRTRRHAAGAGLVKCANQSDVAALLCCLAAGGLASRRSP